MPVPSPLERIATGTRVIVALIAAGFITFSANHSVRVGLAALFAYTSAVVIGQVGTMAPRRLRRASAASALPGRADSGPEPEVPDASARRAETKSDSVTRWGLVAHTLACLLAAVLAFWLMSPGQESVAGFIILVAAWALVSGAIEFLLGLRARRRRESDGGFTVIGAITVAFGVVIALVPPDLHVQYGGLERAPGALTAATQAVGLLGAYLAIIVVLLAIEGLSSWMRRKVGSTGEAHSIRSPGGDPR